jgi:hypothetical protein
MTRVQLNAYSNLSHVYCTAVGFLLGPNGELWDLNPFGSRPLLHAHAAAGSLVLPDGKPVRSLNMRIPHEGRYLELSTVDESRQVISVIAELKGGAFALSDRAGLTIEDAARRRTFSELYSDGWQWAAGSHASYLLVAARSTDTDVLLDHAFAEPLAPAFPELDSPVVIVPGVRSRPSPLAGRLTLPRLSQDAAECVRWEARLTERQAC